MLFFDTLREGREVLLALWCPKILFRPCSPSAGEQPALFTSSQSAVMWCDCTELQPSIHATTASAFMTSIFAWVVPFTLLNSVTGNSCECKEKAVLQFWAVKLLLLRPVCQRPITANCTGQDVQAAIGGFSPNACWQDIRFSVGKAAIVKWRWYIGLRYGRLLYEVFKGFFLGPDRRRQTARERGAGRERERGIQVFAH